MHSPSLGLLIEHRQYIDKWNECFFSLILKEIPIHMNEETARLGILIVHWDADKLLKKNPKVTYIVCVIKRKLWNTDHMLLGVAAFCSKVLRIPICNLKQQFCKNCQ